MSAPNKQSTKKVSYRDIRPKKNSPPKEITFRERLVGLYLDEVKKQQEIRLEKQRAGMANAFARVRSFLGLNDIEADDMELGELADGRPYIVFRDIRLFPEPGGDMRFVAACPFCQGLVPSDVHFSNHTGLGEQVFREDNKTFRPEADHLRTCPTCPEANRPKKLEWVTPDPVADFINHIVSLARKR